MKRYLCLALLALAAASAVASEIALDLRPRAVRTRGVAAPRATQTEEEAGTLRQTVLDAGAASTGSLAVGDVLRLSVYDDVTLSLTLVAREEAPLARASFQAEVSGANWRDAVVTETDAGLLVTATDPASGLVYAVVSSDDRVTVREIDPHALPVVDGGVRVPELDAVRDGVPTKRSAASTDQASTVVDMLVAYDRPAAAWAKANGGGVTNLAQQCVARMNGALANNGLDTAFRFRLVGVMAVDADGDGNLNDTLDKVTQKTGAWAAVSAMRDAVGADVVSTMVDTGSAYGTTGLGWSLTQTTESGMRNFSEHAYNVLSVRAAAQSHVMAHETGHNMGAGHADAQTSSPGPQSFPYSRGFYFTGTDKRAYHTVMAYNNDGYGNSYDPAPLFSDPDNAWAGVPAGDETHDNAQVLSRTYAAVAQFRAQKVALTYDVFFSPEGGALFSDSVTVTLTPGKAGLAIRYTTDGSDPTATHGSLYTSPLTLTKTTTIRAATVTDGTTGPVYAATYYKSDLGAALNAPQLVWNTSADYPWTAQATNTYDGTLAVQSAALPKGTVNRTWLSTTVTGPTKMSFRYRAKMWSSAFRVYLDSSVAWQTADAVDDWTLVEVDVPTGVHVVKFEYEQRGYYSDPMFCGIWLDDVRWIPEGSEGVTRMDGNGNEILIPASWFERHGLAPAGATAADLAAAADADSDGDGMGNWTEYVCGTDPNNADDRLRCTISFVDGSPVVGYEPRDGYLSGYRAVLKGKASLSDAPCDGRDAAAPLLQGRCREEIGPPREVPAPSRVATTGGTRLSHPRHPAGAPAGMLFSSPPGPS